MQADNTDTQNEHQVILSRVITSNDPGHVLAQNKPKCGTRYI